MMTMRKWADGYEQVVTAEQAAEMDGEMLAALGRKPQLPNIRGAFKRLDRVRLGNGSVMIVTGYHPNRPANCYSGVLENGQGKEYVFGAKHRPEKIGEVTEGHPALLGNQTRKERRVTNADPSLLCLGPANTIVLRKLIEAVGAGNMLDAKVFANALKSELPA